MTTYVYNIFMETLLGSIWHCMHIVIIVVATVCTNADSRCVIAILLYIRSHVS